jgi:hypothetical protein
MVIHEIDQLLNRICPPKFVKLVILWLVPMQTGNLCPESECTPNHFFLHSILMHLKSWQILYHKFQILCHLLLIGDPPQTEARGGLQLQAQELSSGNRASQSRRHQGTLHLHLSILV